MRSLVIGTAGHIDHGKTALIRALTGTDTDRLPEEKRRGITIDLGFARLGLDDGTVAGIVDVPGHEGFIRTMLAGATGIDLVLLVIAADEGVMPQTREHLAIVELLGVQRGVVAVTKTDLVEPGWLELVLDELRERLVDSAFRDAMVVPVSARTGAGIDVLRSALSTTAATTPEREQSPLFRMPVDRAFTIRGTGTVVTGTVWSGKVAREASVRILPAGIDARVRGVQAHGNAVGEARAGQRAALALAGVARADVRRGDVLVTSPAWRAHAMLTVRMRAIPDTEWLIRPRQRVRVHLGTAEVMARVALLGRDGLRPGDAAFAQLRLERPLVARAGDRFVVRSYSPVTTIGGGVVLEPFARKRRRLDLELERLLRALESAAEDPSAARAALGRAAGWRGIDPLELPLLLPARAAADVAPLLEVDGRLYAPEIVEEAIVLVDRAIAAGHARQPLAASIGREELRRTLPGGAHPALADHALDRLLREGAVEPRGGAVARRGWEPRLSEAQRLARERLLSVLRTAGCTPPLVSELRTGLADVEGFDELLALLEADGRIVRLTPELYVERGALDQAIEAVRGTLGARSGLGPSDFRAALPVSRKYLIPLLEHLDRQGVTRREGERRAVLVDR
ncbi:MAG: selenocysteine-specific translation elongation factor [Longimicrobiales bacterium]